MPAAVDLHVMCCNRHIRCQLAAQIAIDREQCTAGYSRSTYQLSHGKFNSSEQWLKCHRRRRNAVPPPPVFFVQGFPTSNFQKTQRNIKGNVRVHQQPHFSVLCIDLLHSFTVFTTQNPCRKRERECTITLK